MIQNYKENQDTGQFQESLKFNWLFLSAWTAIAFNAQNYYLLSHERLYTYH